MMFKATLSSICQRYSISQFYCWRKPEYPREIQTYCESNIYPPIFLFKQLNCRELHLCYVYSLTPGHHGTMQSGRRQKNTCLQRGQFCLELLECHLIRYAICVNLIVLTCLTLQHTFCVYAIYKPCLWIQNSFVLVLEQVKIPCKPRTINIQRQCMYII